MNPRAKAPHIFTEIDKLWASRLGLMSLAFALGGAFGTGAIPVVQGWFGDGTGAAIDSTLIMTKQIADRLPPIEALQAEHDAEIKETRKVVREHSDYLYGLYSPWSSPYRGTR